MTTLIISGLCLFSIGLITVLTLVIVQLRQQKRRCMIMQQKLREADNRADASEQQYEEHLGQLNDQINGLQNQLKKSHQQLDRVNDELSDKRLSITQLQKIAEEKEKAKKDANDLYKEIEKEIERETRDLKGRNQALETINEQLKKENQHLRSMNSPFNKDEFIVLKVMEKELYPQEKKDILIDVLKKALTNIHDNSRRCHLITDVVANNTTLHSQRESMRAEIQTLFRDYKRMDPRTKTALERMGFEIVSENSHYKIVFCGDRRYTIAFAKTPSDSRAGKNIASDICNLLF